jgi:hypothetical protein
MEALRNLTELFNLRVKFTTSFSFATHKSNNLFLVSLLNTLSQVGFINTVYCRQCSFSTWHIQRTILLLFIECNISFKNVELKLYIP